MSDTISLVGLDRRIHELNQTLIGTGRPGAAKRILKDQARLFLKEIVKKTPPDNLAQGRNAIKQDILGGRSIGLNGAKKSLGILFRASPSVIKNAEDRGEKAKLWVTKSGDVYGVEKTLFKPNITQPELKAIHYKYRSKATGRTSLAGNFTRDIGRWKFINRLVVPTGQANTYVASQQKKSGRLKGSWAESLLALSGKVAGWILSHTPSPKAIKVNIGTLNGEKPFLLFGSTAAGNNRHVKHSIGRALFVRERKIASDIRYEIREYAAAVRERRPIRSRYPLEGGGE